MIFVNLSGLKCVFPGGSQLLDDGIGDPVTFLADDFNELLPCLSKLPEGPLGRNAFYPSATMWGSKASEHSDH